MVAIGKKKDPQPDDVQQAAIDFLKPFVERHIKLIGQVHRFRQMTDTEAWGDIYRRGVARWESSRQSVVHDLEQFVELLKQNRDPAEDDLKAVKDAVKHLSEAHAGHNAWWINNVAHLVQAAEAVGSICDEAERKARDAEQANPLTARGLAAEVQKMVRQWLRYSFDRKTGTIETVDPS